MQTQTPTETDSQIRTHTHTFNSDRRELQSMCDMQFRTQSETHKDKMLWGLQVKSHGVPDCQPEPQRATKHIEPIINRAACTAYTIKNQFRCAGFVAASLHNRAQQMDGPLLFLRRLVRPGRHMSTSCLPVAARVAHAYKPRNDVGQSTPLSTCSTFLLRRHSARLGGLNGCGLASTCYLPAYLPACLPTPTY